MTEQEFLSKFDIKNSTGNKHTARCPLCGDKGHQHHLCITIEDAIDDNTHEPMRRAALACNKNSAEHDAAAILQYYGMAFKDCYFKNGTPSTSQHRKNDPEHMPFDAACKRTLVNSKNIDTSKRPRSHEYKDRDGNIVARKFIAYQTDGKKLCRWFATAPNNEVYFSLNGIKVPLFHAEMLAAAPNEDVVFAEGEKDANTLRNLGYLATSAPNGGGQTTWVEEWDSLIAGRKKVFVLTDNDDTGAKYGTFIAENATRLGCRTFIVPATDIYKDVQPHGDITDILEAIGADECKKLLNDALLIAQDHPYHSKANTPEAAASTTTVTPFTTHSAASILETEYKPLWEPVKGLITEGMTIFAGSSKIGKSWMALEMAYGIASGNPVFDRPTEKSPVLYCALEDSARRIKSRLVKLGHTSSEGAFDIIFMQDVLGGENDAGWNISEQFNAKLELWLQAQPQRCVVIIDVFQKVRGAARQKEDAYQADYRVFSAIKNIADKYNAAIVALHHTRKGRSEDVFERISGSNGIMGVADTTIIASRERGEDRITITFQGRDVHGEDFFVDMKEDTFGTLHLDTVTSSMLSEQDAKVYETSPTVNMLRDLLIDNPRGNKITYRAFREKCIGQYGYCEFNDRDGHSYMKAMIPQLLRRDNIRIEFIPQTIRFENTTGRGFNYRRLENGAETSSRQEKLSIVTSNDTNE